MADRKSRKKNKKNSNKSSKQKKINKTRSEDRNSNSRPDYGSSNRSDQRTNERSSPRGRISTCYQMVVSRITRPFSRGAVATQNDGATNTGTNEGHRNDGPACEPSVPESKLAITKQSRNSKMAITHQRELYDAVQDLLKPKRPAITNDVPSVKISFSIRLHSNITSVLIEMLNNIPDLHDSGSENDEWLLLRKLLSGGSFASSSTRNKREENVRKRRRRLKMIMFLAKASSVLPTGRSITSLLQTRTENTQPSRNDTVMQPSLLEVAQITTQKTSPKTRATTMIANHTLPIYSVKRPISKGGPSSWTNVKARNYTIPVNQMTKTKAAQSYRDDKKMQPSLLEVAQITTQKTSPKTRATTMIATRATTMIANHTLPIYSVKRPISKGGPSSWTNVKARNYTIPVNQMIKTKTAQSYRDDKKMQPSLAQMILYSVQNKMLRKKTSAMTPKRTVPDNVMQRPIWNSWSHLPNRYNTTSTISIRTTADFPHRSSHIPSLKDTRPFGLLKTGRETKPCVVVTETANTGQLVTLTECIRISLHFDCGTQTLLLDNDSFWSMLEVLQNEFLIETERTASDAFALPSFSAYTVSSRDTYRISITVELPGSKTLQVSSVPVSLLQRLLQRFSEGSMITFSNRYRSTYNRNFTKSVEAKTVSTGRVSPRCETAVRGFGEWLRSIVLPDEAITAVSETFMEMNIDNEFLPFYKELEYTGNYATFTRQTKHRPIPEEAVTAVAVKHLESNEYTQELVIYKEIYNTEQTNVRTIINSDSTCGVKPDLEMEATKSISKEEQGEIHGNETKIKEDKVDKKVLKESTSEDIDDVGSLKYMLFKYAGEMRKPTKRYQKRINFYSIERLPIIPEEPEDQDNFTECEFDGNAVKVDKPTDGTWISKTDHGKLSATYEQRDHTAFKGEKSKEYQEFDASVPSHLGHIEIQFKDITDVVFEKDDEGEPLILSSGGFGDIYKARLVDTDETIIVKTIEDMDFEEILRETRIQMYLVPGQYVPAIRGIIVVQGQPEIMILQQFCARGRTLYDVIDACMAETITLLDSHWLQLAYKLVLSYENMHRKGVLHNDIKSDNILVELKGESPYKICN